MSRRGRLDWCRRAIVHHVPIIVALLTDRGERERLGSVLAAFGTTRFCDRTVEVWQAIATGEVTAVVLAGPDADGRSMIPLAGDLVRRFPSLPVLASVRAAAEGSAHDRAELALLRGVTAFDPDRPQAFFALARRLIAPARAQSARGMLLDIVAPLEPGWPAVMSEYIRTVVLHARWPLTVRAVMDLIDPTKRRTLDQQLRHGRLPTAEQLIGWVFVVQAMWLWALPGVTLEASARSLGFNDAGALRSLIVHRTGLSPTEVRKRGGVTYVVSRFAALLRGDWSGEPAGRDSVRRAELLDDR
jgi:hypothetical protein